MRITSIRTKNNSKPESVDMQRLMLLIKARFKRAGFITDITSVSPTALKIGLHMRCFSIDTVKLGSNARLGAYTHSPKGYKRTNLPTWNQRVEFNDIVNACLDKFNYTASVRSGPFTIRDKTRAQNKNDWQRQKPDHMGPNGEIYNGVGQVCIHIMSESDAREHCDSDRLEREHAALQRPKRLAQAREARIRMKLFRQARKVTIDGFYAGYDKTNPQNGRVVTHAAFEKLLAKQSGYTKRDILKASIAATLAKLAITAQEVSA